MEEYEKELSHALLSAYRGALSSAVRSCCRAVPALSAGLQESLRYLQPRLSATLTPAEIDGVQSEFDGRLLRWEEDAAQISHENLASVKDIMMAVAASASAIASRDDRYNRRIGSVTAKLDAIARIEDLRAMRQSVVESASEIRTCAEEMRREGERSIAVLQAQVAEYRTKLSEYQLRGSTDPLTGLANRASIEARIQDRIAWSSNFCLAILDLNGFKRINDSHGHAAGDDLLRQFAQELPLIFRASDVVGRWGGDEFVLVMDSTPDDAKTLLERLRQWVFGEYTITNGEQSTTVMISAAIGLASWDGKETAAELFNRADQLMYDDKRTTCITGRPGNHRAQRVSRVAAVR